MQRRLKEIRQEVVSRLSPALPRSIREQVIPKKYAWSYRDLRTVAKTKPGEVRGLIAPANFAAQGYYWARAAELLPDVSCVNLRFYRPESTVNEPADFDVPINVGQFSHLWARKQQQILKMEFTHVLLEAEMPLFGALYNADIEAEIRALQHAGLKVATVAHGSDVRLPSLHRELEPSSPFFDPLDGITDILEQKVTRNLKILDRLGLPEFVSTPDLLEFRPKAKWLPTYVTPDRWLELPLRPQTIKPPKVLQLIPQNPHLKGTIPISDVLRQLHHERTIELVQVTRIPTSEMPALIGTVDIVVEQVGMGLYGVLGLESMLAGKVVVAQVWDSVRRQITADTGLNLPIVEANARTLHTVIKELASDPDRRARLSVESRNFAAEAHSKVKVAGVLGTFFHP